MDFQSTLNSIKLSKVSKSFGATHVLHNIHLSIEQGQIVGIQGANGSGKSTLLSMIAGLLKPDQGEVLFNGEPFEKHPGFCQSSMGYLSHDHQLYAHLSGRENLFFYGKLFAVLEFNQKVEDWVETLDMQNFIDRPVHTYSKGQLQRVAFAKAVLHSPVLLLLDEPLSGLDADTSDILLRWIMQMKQNGGMVLFISHQLPLLHQLSDHVFELKSGRLEQNQIHSINGTEKKELS